MLDTLGFYLECEESGFSSICTEYTKVNKKFDCISDVLIIVEQQLTQD